MTLSNTAGGGVAPLVSSYVASPGRRDLYGKNPEENIRIATGMRPLANQSTQFLGIDNILMRIQ